MYRIEESKARNLYRNIIGIVIICTLFFMGIYFYIMSEHSMPSDIKITVNKDNSFSSAIPLTASFNKECIGAISIDNKLIRANSLKVRLDNKYSIKGRKIGKYKANLKAFGIISLKKINVEVVDKKKVIVGGIPVGIYVETDGLLVLGTGNICGRDGVEYSPAKNIIRPGDYIMAINDIKVSNKKKFIEHIQKIKEEDLKLTIRRNNKTINVAVKKIKCKDGNYKIGTWIRNNMQGIGTLTYYDPIEKKYGALGHGINDVDTNKLMEIKIGSLYSADIIDIVKGRKNNPGEIVGVINHSNMYRLGDLKKNTSYGIYGSVDNVGEKSIESEVSKDQYIDELDIALRQEVRCGKAIIRTKVDNKIGEYSVTIDKINTHNTRSNKNFILTITDKKLIELTGGIVQGMSGSPIIQNGRIVGALTHVFVNDPKKGYGIFIENML